MRRVVVQIGARLSDNDDTDPVVVSIEEDGAVGSEWVATTVRIAGDEAIRVVSRIADSGADTDP